MNAMVYFRGFPKDYNDWEALGNTGWGYDQVKEVFNRIENNQAMNISDFENISVDGPLKIDYFYSQNQVRDVFMSGLTELGYPWARDFNGDDRIGFTNAEGNLYRGIRQSPARAYLIPAANRSNLHVVKHATVLTLIMSGKRAVGVKFLKDSMAYEARASKEVILSAGAIASPQILMNSGIGPKDHLESMNIKPIVDLPVGNNLQDHAGVPLYLGLENIDGQVDFSQLLDNIYLYFKNGTGSYSAPQSPDFNGFINTKSIQADHPDIQTQHIIFERNSPNLRAAPQLSRFRKRYIDQVMEVNKQMTVAVTNVVLCNPKSTGTIRLTDDDPQSYPLITPNYLNHQDDIESIVEGLKIFHSLLDTQSFRENGARFIQFEHLDCQDYPSDSYWECYARYFSISYQHATGTTKMGPESDPTAVVDPRLRVHGVEGLRVCDAGIQPNVVTVNINPSVIMTGERCADFIKEEHSQ